jgi:hypothetical protein
MLGPTKEDGSSPTGQSVEALRLVYLRLVRIALPKDLTKTFQRIDVLALSELHLDSFAGSGNLLEGVSLQFAKGTSCLKKLSILRLPEQDAEDFITGLFLLLTSFCGLQKLELLCKDCGKVNSDGIVNYGETSTELSIVNGGIYREDASRCFSANDLENIATTCTELKHLYLNIYEMDTDRFESEILGPQRDVAFQPSEFEQALTAIATIPTLLSLHLTNPPNYRKSYYCPGEFFRWHARSLQNGSERFAFQARADGIMQHLGVSGSNIMTLNFSPVESLRKAEAPDRHGHVWPDYAYRRVRMTGDGGKKVAITRALEVCEDQRNSESTALAGSPGIRTRRIVAKGRQPGQAWARLARLILKATDLQSEYLWWIGKRTFPNAKMLGSFLLSSRFRGFP